MLRDLADSGPGVSYQGDAGDAAPIPELDSAGLHLRDSAGWSELDRDAAQPVPRSAGIQEHHIEMSDGNWRSTDRAQLQRQVGAHVHRNADDYQ